ncbi:uncharacterized protein METZ01_LOCUS131883, partial [marine metagenome]
MMKIFKLTFLILLITQASHSEEIVNFYNWADYIGENTIENFEEEYGIKVNYDTYD